MGRRLPQLLCTPLALLALSQSLLLMGEPSKPPTLSSLPRGAGMPQAQDGTVITWVLRPSQKASAIIPVSQMRKLRLRKVENLPSWSALGALTELCPHNRFGSLMGTSVPQSLWGLSENSSVLKSSPGHWTLKQSQLHGRLSTESLCFCPPDPQPRTNLQARW